MSTADERMISTLEAALCVRPNDAWKRLQLGRAYHRVGKLEAAEEAIRRALRDNPELADAHFELGRLALDGGNQGAATDAFEATLACDADHYGARLKLAELALQHRHWSEARGHYAELVRIKPEDVGTLRAAAEASAASGDRDGAIGYLDGARRLLPDDPEVLGLLVNHLADAQAWPRIYEVVDRRESLGELSGECLIHAGIAAETAHDDEFAYRCFSERLSRGEERRARIGVARSLVNRRRYSEAAESLAPLEAPEPEELVLLGRVESGLAQWLRASEHLREALRALPDRSDVEQLLGIAYARLGRFPEGIELLQSALRAQPSSTEGWSELAEALAAAGRQEGAVDALGRASALDNSDVDLATRYARALEGAGRHEPALLQFQRCSALQPREASHLVSQARCLQVLGRDERAEGALREAARLDPFLAEAYRLLGRLLQGRGRHAEAIEALKEAVRLGGEPAEDRVAMALSLCETDQPEQALQELEGAKQHPPERALAWRLEGTALVRLGRFRQAVPPLKRATELEPDDAVAWAEWGRAAAALADWPAAESAFAKATEQLVAEAELWRGLGQARCRSGRASEALEPLQRAVELASSDVAAWCLLSEALLSSGRASDAQLAAEKGLTVDAHEPTLLEIAGLAAAASGNRALAVTRLEAAVASEPRAASAWAHLGELYGLGGRLAERINALSHLLDLDPAAHATRAQLAAAHYEAAQHADALPLWKQILTDDAENVEALLGLAACLRALGRDPEAIEPLQLALRLAPQRSEEGRELGVLLAQQGRDEEAIDWLEHDEEAQLSVGQLKALAGSLLRLGRSDACLGVLERWVECAPNDIEAWSRLGLLAATEGRRPRAIEALRRAVELGGQAPELRRTLGRSLIERARDAEAAGDDEAALGDWLAAREQDELDAELLEKLALTYDRLGRPREAADAAARSVSLAPDRSEYHVLHGRLLLVAGEPAQAVRALEGATALDAGQAQAWHWLALAERARGRYAEATVAYQRALELTPDDADDRLEFARLLLSERRYDEASEQAAQVVAVRPLDEVAFRTLARARGGQGATEQAIEAWGAVLRSAPDDSEALFECGLGLYRLGRFQATIEHFRRLDGREERPEEVLPLLGRALHELGRDPEAIEVLQRAEPYDASDELLLALAKSRLRAADAAAAEESLRKLLARSPSHTEALRLLSQAFVDQGREAEAREALERVVGGQGASAEGAGELIALQRKRLQRATEEGAPAEAVAACREIIRLVPSDLEAHLALSESESAREDLGAALEAARGALSLAPAEPRARLLLATLLERAGMLDEAATAYEAALEVHEETLAHAGAARVLSALQRPEAALEHLLRAVTYSVRDAEIRGELVALAAQLDRASLVIEHADALSRLRPLAADELLALGSAQCGQGKPRAAVESFEEALELGGPSVACLKGLAAALQQADRKKSAATPLRDACAICPEDVELWRLLLQALIDVEDWAEGAVAAQQAVAHHPTDRGLADAWVACAEALADDAVLAEAIQHWAALSPDEAEAHRRLGFVLADLRRDGEAIVALQRSAQLADLSSPELERRLAELHLRVARQKLETSPQQARVSLLEAASHASGDSALQYEIAVDLADLGATQQALEICERVMQEDATAWQAAVLAGRLAEEEGERERAATAYEQAAASKIDSVAALLGSGRTRMQLGQYSEAEVALGRAARLDPDNEEILGLQRVVLERQGRSDDSIEAQRRLAALKPEDVAAQRELVVMLAAAGRHEETLAAAEPALAASPRDAALRAITARALFALGQSRDALQAAEQALLLEPARADALLVQGQACARLGRDEDAVVAFEAALEAGATLEDIAEELVALHRGLGESQERAGEAVRAAGHYERAAALKGDDPLLLLALARTRGLANSPGSALAAARRALQLDPANVQCWTLAGELEAELGRFQEAESCLRRATELDDDDARVSGALGLVLAQQSRDAEAIELLARATQSLPQPKALRTLARLLDAVGRRAEFVSALQRLRQVDVLATSELERMGEALIEEGDFEAATSVLEDLVGGEEQRPAHLVLLGRARLMAADHERAIELLERARALAPDARQVDEWLGRALAAAGRALEAVEALEREVARSPSVALLELLAEQQAAAGDGANQIDALYRAVRLDPDDTENRLRLVRALASVNRMSEAIAEAEQAHERDRSEPTRELLLGLLLRELALLGSDAPGARTSETLARAVQLAAGDAEALLGVGEAALSLSQWAMARAAAEEALGLLPDDPRAWACVGRASRGRDDWDHAAEALERAASGDVDVADVIAELGEAECHRGRPEAARRAWLRALKVDAEQVTARRAWLNFEWSTHPASEAIAPLRELVELLPSDWEPKVALGRALLEEGQVAESLSLLREVRTQGAAEGRHWVLLARALEANGERDAAVEAATRALGLDPEQADARAIVGQGALDRGDDDQAVEALERAFLEQPSDRLALQLASAHSTRAGHLEANGEFGAASASYRRALELRPEPETRLGLCRALRATKQRQEAIELLRSAHASGVESPASWLLLGRTYRDAGLEQEASEAFEQAKRLDPQQRAAWQELSETLAALGRTEPAAQAAERAHELQPSDAAAEHAVRLLLLAARPLAAGDREAVERAVALLERARRLPGHDYEVRSLLAEAHSRLGQGAVAEAMTRETLSSHPHDLALLELLGQMLATRGAHQELIELLGSERQAIEASPELARALGIAYVELGRHQDACDVLGPCVDEPAAPVAVLIAWARACDALGRATEACRALERAHRQQALQGTLLQRLGELLHESGRAAEAARVLGDAARDRPDDVRAQLTHAGVLMEDEQLEAALEPLQLVLRYEPRNVAALRMQADALFRLERHELAAEPLKLLIQLDPQPAELERLAQCHFAAGRRPEAIAMLDRWASAAPTDWRANLRLGLARADAGHSLAAMEALRAALRENPELPQAQAKLLELYRVAVQRALGASDFVAALELLDLAHAQEPANDEIELQRVDCLLRCERWQEGLADAERLVRRLPKRPGAWLLLGRAQIRSKQLEGAARSLTAGLAVSPREPQLLVELLGVYERLGWWEQAFATSQQAVSLQPTDVRALLSLSRAALATQRVQEAERALQAALQRDGRCGEALAQLGKLRAGQRQFDAAVQLLLQARAVQPDDPTIAADLALALSAAGRLAEARDAGERAARQFPSDAKIAVALGFALRDLQDFSAAVVQFERAAALGLKRVELQVQIADLHERAGQARRAAAALARAVELQPKDTRLRVRVAQLLSQCGAVGEAVVHLEVAASLSPAEPELRYRLGSLYVANGRRAEAQAQAQALRSMDPALAQRLERLLAGV